MVSRPPLEEGAGFLRVAHERSCDDLCLCDDGRGLPVNTGCTLEIVGQRRRLEFPSAPHERRRVLHETWPSGWVPVFLTPNASLQLLPEAAAKRRL
jgi:hypothetical protein